MMTPEATPRFDTSPRSGYYFRPSHTEAALLSFGAQAIESGNGFAFLDSPTDDATFNENVEKAGKNTKLAVVILIIFVAVAVGGTVIGMILKGKPEGTMAHVLPFTALSFFLLVGVALRALCSPLRRAFIPSGLIGGAVACLFVQLWAVVDDNPSLEAVTAPWIYVPPFALNIIFSVLMLGDRLPHLSEVWGTCCVQLSYGQLLTWGQFAIGLSSGFFIGKAFGLPLLFGATVPLGFQGGHAYASALADQFTSVKWAEGYDFTSAAATLGLFLTLLQSIILLNWYRRYRDPAVSHPSHARMLEGEQAADAVTTHVFMREKDKANNQYRVVIHPAVVDNFAFHIAAVAMAISFGYGAKALLQSLEPLVRRWAGINHSFRTFPMFPFCMLGGILLQLLLQYSGHETKICRTTLRHLSSTALDYLIVAAVGSLNVKNITDGFLPLLCIAALCYVYQLAMLLFVAPRYFNNHWFERGIVEFGQSTTGITAAGLHLLSHAGSPEAAGEVTSAFAYKQLLHEPIGGIWTSVVITIITHSGVWTACGVAGGAVIVWGALYLLFLRKTENRRDGLSRIIALDRFDEYAHRL